MVQMDPLVPRPSLVSIGRFFVQLRGGVGTGLGIGTAVRSQLDVDIKHGDDLFTFEYSKNLAYSHKLNNHPPYPHSRQYGVPVEFFSGKTPEP